MVFKKVSWCAQKVGARRFSRRQMKHTITSNLLQKGKGKKHSLFHNNFDNNNTACVRYKVNGKNKMKSHNNCVLLQKRHNVQAMQRRWRRRKMIEFLRIFQVQIIIIILLFLPTLTCVYWSWIIYYIINTVVASRQFQTISMQFNRNWNIELADNSNNNNKNCMCYVLTN